MSDNLSRLKRHAIDSEIYSCLPILKYCTHDIQKSGGYKLPKRRSPGYKFWQLIQSNLKLAVISQVIVPNAFLSEVIVPDASTTSIIEEMVLNVEFHNVTAMKILLTRNLIFTV